MDYQGTNLSSIAEANNIFNGLYAKEPGKSLSSLFYAVQCYQRAHGWSYQMWQERKIKSYKVFLFYSKAYRKRMGERWPYHVAPVVLVNGRPMVFDHLFLKEPQPIEEWVTEFIDDKILDTGYKCGVMKSWEDFDRIQEKDFNGNWCLLKVVPMYYFHYDQVRDLDRNGMATNTWVADYLNQMRGGFRLTERPKEEQKIYGKYYPNVLWENPRY